MTTSIKLSLVCHFCVASLPKKSFVSRVIGIWEPVFYFCLCRCAELMRAFHNELKFLHKLFDFSLFFQETTKRSRKDVSAFLMLRVLYSIVYFCGVPVMIISWFDTC